MTTLTAGALVKFRMTYEDPSIVELTFHEIAGKWYAWTRRQGAAAGRLEVIPERMMRP